MQRQDPKKSWRQAVSNLHARDKERYRIQTLCGLLGVSKQAYYQGESERLLSKAAMRDFAIEFARSIREKDPGIGIVKVWFMYQEKFRNEQDILGRDQFIDLLAKAGMKVRLKIGAPKTTDSSHGLPVYPNLVKDFIPLAPNQLWVSDITYIEIWMSDEEYTFCYLSMVMDAYTKEIIGWSVGATLEAIYPIEALRMALSRPHGAELGTIHHSDRGTQYASCKYVDILNEHNIAISMTEGGDPKDNSQAERINNTMKNELLKGKVFHSIGEVRKAVGQAVDFYNNERPHMSLDMLPPAEAAGLTGDIKKRWRSFREEAIREKQPAVG